MKKKISKFSAWPSYGPERLQKNQQISANSANTMLTRRSPDSFGQLTATVQFASIGKSTSLMKELSPYNTVVQGQGNYVRGGTKEIILGSFNNVTGGGANWIFTNYFTGQASGDLIVQRYRVQMDKKHLTSTRPDLVVFLLTPTETGQYSKYINPNQNLPNAQSGVISLLKAAGIASQQINSYNVPYQPPQPQIQQKQFQHSQFKSSQSRFQSSSNSFGFQVVQRPTQPGSQQNLRGSGGFTLTSNSNMGGFTASSGFTTTSSPSFAGFTRV